MYASILQPVLEEGFTSERKIRAMIFLKKGKIPLFNPNIDKEGRKARAIGSGICLLGSLAFFFIPRPWPIWIVIAFWGLMSTGLFMLFEALKGWCALRACGIKTRI